MKYIPLDKYGWPVERIRGRHIINIIRILIHTRSIITQQEWDRRMKERYSDIADSMVCSMRVVPRIKS